MREGSFRIITISSSFGLTTGVEAMHATFVVILSYLKAACPSQMGRRLDSS